MSQSQDLRIESKGLSGQFVVGKETKGLAFRQVNKLGVYTSYAFCGLPVLVDHRVEKESRECQNRSLHDRCHRLGQGNRGQREAVSRARRSLRPRLPRSSYQLEMREDGQIRGRDHGIEGWSVRESGKGS